MAPDEDANLKGETIWGPKCYEYHSYKGARMDGVTLRGEFKNTIFSGVTFVDATFESCVFNNCTFDGAIIKDSKFKINSNLSKTVRSVNKNVRSLREIKIKQNSYKR